MKREEVYLVIDQLKKQAEALGYELVEKKRVPKVGDFGVFGEYSTLFGFISEIENNNFADSHGSIWDNFRHLTEEEKTKIQNNW